MQRPPRAHALLVLGHGAGAPMTHTFFETLCTGLSENGIATLRFNFPYMTEGKKIPDRTARATATWETVLAQAKQWAEELPIFAGGKSYGGRMLSVLFAERPIPEVKGLICYGYPLHPPGRPDQLRAAHLPHITHPMLFFQGTRDALAQVALVQQHLTTLPQAEIVLIDSADHSFKVLKRSSITQTQVWDLIIQRTTEWIAHLIT